MGKKRPLKCSNCKGRCVEVGRDLFYPKRVDDPEALRRGRVGYVYRYLCPVCDKEYIYETLQGRAYGVPNGADFTIRLRNGEEMIRVNSPHLLKFWGLSPEKRGVVLSAEEVRKLQARVERIRHGLSSRELDDEVFIWERLRLTPAETQELLGREI